MYLSDELCYSNFLNENGIKCSKVKISEKKQTGNIHRITIVGRKAIVGFIDDIGSEHPAKSRRLSLMKALILNSERGTCG